MHNVHAKVVIVDPSQILESADTLVNTLMRRVCQGIPVIDSLWLAARKTSRLQIKLRPMLEAQHAFFPAFDENSKHWRLYRWTSSSRSLEKYDPLCWLDDSHTCSHVSAHIRHVEAQAQTTELGGGRLALSIHGRRSRTCWSAWDIRLGELSGAPGRPRPQQPPSCLTSPAGSGAAADDGGPEPS